MGRHASSQLTQTVAVEGLADAFMAFNTNYHDSGLFGVYGVTDRWAAHQLHCVDVWTPSSTYQRTDVPARTLTHLAFAPPPALTPVPNERDRCEDFAHAIMSELTKMCYEVNETEVTRAKNQLKASLMFFQDSTHREYHKRGGPGGREGDGLRCWIVAAGWKGSSKQRQPPGGQQGLKYNERAATSKGPQRNG